MATHSFIVYFIFISTTKFLVADFLESKDKCGVCVKPEQCRLFREMDDVEKSKWKEQNPCVHTPGGEIDDNFKPLFGFSSSAKGDLICCPGPNVWGIEGQNARKADVHPDFVDADDSEKPDSEEKAESENPNPEERSAFNDYRRNGRKRFKHSNPRRSDIFDNTGQMPMGLQNAYNPTQNQENSCQQTFSLFPPDPKTKCCGIDVFTEKRNNQPERPSNHNWQPRGPQYWPRYSRAIQFQPDDTVPTVGVEIDPRITGGFQTELEEYPWTTFIQTTFDYGQKSSTFNCGGSLISARYVLTAGHCVSDVEAVSVNSVNVHLAEYDKRTFPEDCKYVPGIGRKCVTNIIIPADKIIPHPEFNEEALQNDIALIRIAEKAPYTDFIRPVCLPMFSVDSPKFMDLRVAVAGWGRDKQGEEISQIKQATVVNLVPYRNCIRYYPALTRNHICAAGKTGQDTCKGDSGGPLMVLYQNQYYIAGVVSGKRSDTKCGSRIPSLYTNVYYYIDWIMSNLKND